MSIIWVPGESTGTNENGQIANSPLAETDIYLVRGSGLPDAVLEWTNVLNGGFYLDGTNLYIWNAEAWLGPYTVSGA